jgi:hypothetical protein
MSRRLDKLSREHDKTRMPSLKLVPALLLLAALPAAAQTATPDCASLPNALWLQIGDTQEPLIKALGQQLLTSTVMPMTLVYITAGSCTNVPALYNKTPITVTASYIPTQTQVPGWTPAMASPTCTNTAGHAIDVANAALFVSTCNSGTPPADAESIEGPVQAYSLVVPTASWQTAMTAEEAYFVFGYGMSGEVTPWTDELHLFTRPTTKSTLLTWAAAIDVPAAKWKGQPQSTSTLVLNMVSQSTAPEATVGLLGAEIYDANRSALKDLAFQWFGQHHAWYPDSSAAAFDKKNLRDGHYAVWSPTFWLTHIDPATGIAVDPRTTYLINLILAKTQTPAFDANTLDTVISVGLVPDCAMKVSRTVEAGPLSFYSPAQPCGCYYDHKTGATPSCATCSPTTTCATGTCRFGYCEAQ